MNEQQYNEQRIALAKAMELPVKDELNAVISLLTPCSIQNCEGCKADLEEAVERLKDLMDRLGDNDGR